MKNEYLVLAKQLNSDVLIGANTKTLLSLHLLNLPVLLDQTWSELLPPLHHPESVPCYCIKEVINNFFTRHLLYIARYPR